MNANLISEIIVKAMCYGISLFAAFGGFILILEIIDYFKQDREERNNPMTLCESCEEPISKMARYCPECGHDYGKLNWTSHVPIVQVFYVLFCLFIVVLFALMPYFIENNL